MHARYKKRDQPKKGRAKKRTGGQAPLPEEVARSETPPREQTPEPNAVMTYDDMRAKHTEMMHSYSALLTKAIEATNMLNARQEVQEQQLKLYFELQSISQCQQQIMQQFQSEIARMHVDLGLIRAQMRRILP